MMFDREWLARSELELFWEQTMDEGENSILFQNKLPEYI